MPEHHLLSSAIIIFSSEIENHMPRFSSDVLFSNCILEPLAFGKESGRIKYSHIPDGQRNHIYSDSYAVQPGYVIGYIILVCLSKQYGVYMVTKSPSTSRKTKKKKIP